MPMLDPRTLGQQPNLGMLAQHNGMAPGAQAQPVFNPNTLLALGAGIASGRDWGEGLGRGFSGALQVRQEDAKRNEKYGERNAVFQTLLQRGMDPKQAWLMANSPQTAQLLAQEGQREQAQKNWEASHSLDQQRLKLAGARMNEEPAALQILRAAGIEPSSPEGRKALFPRTDTPISATDKRAIFSAEDEMPALQGTLENLQRALDLNAKTFQGFGAGARGAIGSKLPDWMVPDSVADPKTAQATAEWQRIMAPEALQTMANTLKGATTDFELRKFIEMLGDPATDATTRKSVIERLQRLAQRKMEITQGRLQNLRGGTYFQPGQQQGAQPAQRRPEQPDVQSVLQDAQDAIARGADPNAVRQRLQEMGIQ